MTDWRRFLTIAAERLTSPLRTEKGEGTSDGGSPLLQSWCAWTTFGRLTLDAGYWTAELPKVGELGERSTTDGGTWGQPFPYNDLAHLIIPRQFSEERSYDPDNKSRRGFWQWRHVQDIEGLSAQIRAEKIEYELSQWALQIKLF